MPPFASPNCVKAEFPLVTVLARAFDRGTALQLIRAGVDYQLRETFESALVFGGSTLEALGVDPEDVAEVIEDVRRRDADRLRNPARRRHPRRPALPARAISARRSRHRSPTPRRPGQALNEETAGVLHKSETAD